MEITPADKAHLEFLSRMVDRLQDESFRLDKHPNVQQDLWHAVLSQRVDELLDSRLTLRVVLHAISLQTEMTL